MCLFREVNREIGLGMSFGSLGIQVSRTHGLVEVAEEVEEEHGGVAAKGEGIGGVEYEGGLIHDSSDDTVVVDAVRRIVHQANVIFGVVALGV